MSVRNPEAESELRVVKSIRPGVLPQVAAYLSPRQRVTYYFDAGSGGID